jgi:hypothetical protein
MHPLTEAHPVFNEAQQSDYRRGPEQQNQK